MADIGHAKRALTFELWAEANGYDRKKRRYRKVKHVPRAVPGARVQDPVEKLLRDVPI